MFSQKGPREKSEELYQWLASPIGSQTRDSRPKLDCLGNVSICSVGSLESLHLEMERLSKAVKRGDL